MRKQGTKFTWSLHQEYNHFGGHVRLSNVTNSLNSWFSCGHLDLSSQPDPGPLHPYTHCHWSPNSIKPVLMLSYYTYIKDLTILCLFMMGFFFPNSVFKHNTHPRSAMSKCNSDTKYLVNCENTSQCVKSNPWFSLCRSPPGVNSKGNSITVYCSVIKGHPILEKVVSTPKAWICGGKGNVQYMWACEVNSYQRKLGRSSLARHTGQTGIPIRSFFFFTVFRPVSRRTSSSSDSSISSSAEKRI